ncbi:MAG: hypothetical protein P4L57_06235 [Rhizomicrobium sp.]|nr:hypothetical protein [Rhizomicrobium sp.]
MIRQFMGVGSLVLVALCVTINARAESSITPSQAIEKAAAVAPQGITGTFDVVVRATGDQGGDVFLNSQNDYRDPRNVSVVISPFVGAALMKRFGQSPQSYFVGKHILVTGEAKRVTIWFYSNGVRTNKYYYQTHIILADAGQLQIVQ